MAQNKATILVTDDEKAIRNSLREIFEFEGYEILEAESGPEAFGVIKQKHIDLMLLDIKMQGMDGMEVLEKLQDEKHQFPVIMISGHGNIEVAVEATKKGASDFIAKPPDLNRLLVSVRNALDRHNLAEENKRIRSKLPRFSEIIGTSPVIKEIKNTINKVAPTTSRVLITGDNGTGKELVARWIHAKSKQSSAAFVAVNCAAIPADLLESELFGHEKGSFTGATQQRIGKFEQAHKGTLFLDEIGDMSVDAQSKVLRALQENSITRVGGRENIPVDVRVMAASNKNLKEEINHGSFREDLYHRLNVIPIHVPALKYRRDDIPLLATHYLNHLAQNDITFSNISFSEEALQALKNRPWSGNVRELQNAVERLAVFTDGHTINAGEVEHLAQSDGRDSNRKIKNTIDEVETFQHFKDRSERLFLVQKLKENHWNISQTAKMIDIQRSHMYNKMKKYDIER